MVIAKTKDYQEAIKEFISKLDIVSQRDEHFFVVGLKSGKQKFVELINVGSDNKVAVDFNGLFKKLLIREVDEVYTIHTHPGRGLARFSKGDIQMRVYLRDALGLLGIKYTKDCIYVPKKDKFTEQSLKPKVMKERIIKKTIITRPAEDKEIEKLAKYPYELFEKKKANLVYYGVNENKLTVFGYMTDEILNPSILTHFLKADLSLVGCFADGRVVPKTIVKDIPMLNTVLKLFGIQLGRFDLLVEEGLVNLFDLFKEKEDV